MEKKETILYIFSCLADLEFQKRVWVKSEEFDMYCSSFGEAVNSLDDFNFFDDVDNKQFNFDSNLYIELEHYLEKIVDYEENDNMLDDKEWIELTIRAKDIFNQLNNIPNW